MNVKLVEVTEDWFFRSPADPPHRDVNDPYIHTYFFVPTIISLFNEHSYIQYNGCGYILDDNKFHYVKTYILYIVSA